MMLTNNAVSLIIVLFLQGVKIVCGKNNSSTYYVSTTLERSYIKSSSIKSSDSMLEATSQTKLIPTASKTSVSSLSWQITSSAQTVMVSSVVSRTIHSTNSTSLLSKPDSSELQSTPLLTSATESRSTISSYLKSSTTVLPAKYPSSFNILSETPKASASAVSSSTLLVSPNSTETFSELSSFAFPRSSYFPFSISPSTTFTTQSTVFSSTIKSHISQPSITTQPTFHLSRTSAALSFTSTVQQLVPSSSTSQSSSHTFQVQIRPSQTSQAKFVSSSSYLPTLLLSSTQTPFSSLKYRPTRLEKTTTIFSSSNVLSLQPYSSTILSKSAFSYIETSSQVLPISPTYSISTTPKSATDKLVSTNSSVEIVLITKSSKLIYTTSVRKSLSSDTVNGSTSISGNVQHFIEFDGKLLVSVNYSSKNLYHSMRRISDSLEEILDKALGRVAGYVYSKVLDITTKDHKRKFECTFKIFITRPSSATAAFMIEMIHEYNSTNGFGDFTLHFVQTMVSKIKTSTDEKLYLWAIILIAVLAVLCLLLLVAFIYIKVKLQKDRKRLCSSSEHDKNSPQGYFDFFSEVDGTEETQNVPLKLTSVSSTESKKRLKLSDAPSSESELDDENVDEMNDKSSQGSTFERVEKEDGTIVEMQDGPFPGNGTLQIQEDDEYDEEHDSKFSTFSRKH